MKRIFPPLSLVIITFFFVGCTAPQQARLAMPTSTDDGLIDITILQINDVYEIAPLEGGKIGGMARVATLRKKLLSENKNTYTVHAGDFLNPSLIGTLKYEGERIAGKQMVELMNATGRVKKVDRREKSGIPAELPIHGSRRSVRETSLTTESC